MRALRERLYAGLFVFGVILFFTGVSKCATTSPPKPWKTEVYIGFRKTEKNAANKVRGERVVLYTLTAAGKIREYEALGSACEPAPERRCDWKILVDKHTDGAVVTGQATLVIGLSGLDQLPAEPNVEMTVVGSPLAPRFTWQQAPPRPDTMFDMGFVISSEM